MAELLVSLNNDKHLLTVKAEKLRLLEHKLKLVEGLPHLHGLNLYKWQLQYKDAKFNKKRLICAANQIGKSTIQIMDRLDIATRPDIWNDLWPEAFKINPKTMPYSWYLYPNQDTTNTEFEEKWVPYYLPRGPYKDHPVYGWKDTWQNKMLRSIEFNSGYKIFFKTYNQNVHDLQSGTVFAIDCDEELPENILPELQARLFATDGYFSMAFTATIGQEFWRSVIEEVGNAGEKWPDAWKRQISMFDCEYYADGTPSRWTKQRISTVISNCKNQAEVNRRVHGKFVKTGGLKYTGFDRERNLKPFHKTTGGGYYRGAPPNWQIYTGVDIGSGGDAHPAGIVFLAVSPDLKKIKAFKMRRMDNIITTADDIFKEYTKLRGNITPVMQSYDYSSKDFGTIVERAGESWAKANKSHAIGELALNTALKMGILEINYDPTDLEDEGLKLVHEIEGLGNNKDKTKNKDDLVDALRYALVTVPIDWESLLASGNIVAVGSEGEGNGNGERVRGWTKKETEDYYQSIIGEYATAEMQEFNDLLDG
jgi:hypothetical protein